MRIKRNLQIVTATSQALALILFAPLASLADGDTPIGFHNDKLDNFEQVIYGAPRKNLSQDARLKALEVKLFGEAKSGSYDTRIAAIQKALSYGRGLGAGSSSDLLPPVAGSLDTSSNSGKTAKAPSYSSNDESFSAKDGPDSNNDPPENSKAVADAMQLYTDGKVDQAEQAFRKIIANDPNNGDAYYNLGVIAEGRGDLKSALNDYRQAQRISPQDQDLRDTVTTVSNKIAAGQKTVASSSAKASGRGATPRVAPSYGNTASASNSDSAPAYTSGADRNRLKNMVNDASAKYKKGDYDGAVALLGQVANEAPGDADVQFALGQAYKAKGDTGRARTAMARASALDPGNASYQSALAALTSAASAGVASADGAGDTGITPFAGSHAQPSGGMSGFTSHSSSSMNRRLTRAVEFGLAGAAVGGLTSALMSHRGGGYGYGGRSTGYSSMKSGALRGAVAGSVLGLIFGR